MARAEVLSTQVSSALFFWTRLNFCSYLNHTYLTSPSTSTMEVTMLSLIHTNDSTVGFVDHDTNSILTNTSTKPLKQAWHQLIVYKLHSVGRYLATPRGFLTTIYILNVIAWGGMWFLLLCNASIYMCRPDCYSEDSIRWNWIEIDSQILVSLLCIPALGLAPGRFRNLYHLMKYRLRRDDKSLKSLARHNPSWLRIPQDSSLFEGRLRAMAGGEDVFRAGPPYSASPSSSSSLQVGEIVTASWKLHLIIICMALNTIFQCVAFGFVWGYNRFNRPVWAMPLLIGCAFNCNGIGAIVMVCERKRIERGERSVPEDVRLGGIVTLTTDIESKN